MRAAFRALALAAGLAGCAPEQTLPDGALAPIRIGVVTSLSGTLGSDGPGWANAARLAALEINAAGGPLPGRVIELVIADDETNPARAEGIATRLIEQDGVVAIVGAAASSISLGVAAVASDREIPQVSCCSTSDLVTAFNEERAPEDRYLFRTAPSDLLQARVVAIAAGLLMCERLAVLHLDDSYGQPFGEGIEAAFMRAGGNVVARVPFADEQPSYSAELIQVRDANPDCVAMVAFPGSGGTIVRDWEALSGTPEVTWLGTDGVRTPGFVEEVGNPRAIEGFFGTSPITNPATPEYNTVVDRYRAVFGTDPIPFSSNQYDALAVLGLAIARAGTTDGPAVRDAILEVSAPPADRGVVRAGGLAEGLLAASAGQDIDYRGASGNVDFDAMHNVVTAYEIWRYDAPGTTPCEGADRISNDGGSFCRFRTIAAEEIR